MFENLTFEPAPSLNALRAFEAVARTGGVSLAAAELSVTHSAVSRQVKALEASLGVRLFQGPKHRLELTPAGRDLAPALTAAFDQIAVAVRRSRGAGEDLHVAEASRYFEDVRLVASGDYPVAERCPVLVVRSPRK